MKRLLDWSAREVTGRKLVGFLVLLTLLDLILSAVIASVMVFVLHIELPDTVTFRMPFTAWYTLPVALVIMIVEEFLFRFAPLSLAVTAWGRSEKVLAVAAISGILFGLWHGSYFHIFVQGIGGFIYCLMFLKAAGFKGKFVRAGSVCLLLHVAFNAIVVALSYASGNRDIPVRLPMQWSATSEILTVLALVVVWALLFQMLKSFKREQAEAVQLS